MKVYRITFLLIFFVSVLKAELASAIMSPHKKVELACQRALGALDPDFAIKAYFPLINGSPISDIQVALIEKYVRGSVTILGSEPSQSDYHGFKMSFSAVQKYISEQHTGRKIGFEHKLKLATIWSRIRFKDSPLTVGQVLKVERGLQEWAQRIGFEYEDRKVFFSLFHDFKRDFDFVNIYVPVNFNEALDLVPRLANVETYERHIKQTKTEIPSFRRFSQDFMKALQEWAENGPSKELFIVSINGAERLGITAILYDYSIHRGLSVAEAIKDLQALTNQRGEALRVDILMLMFQVGGTELLLGTKRLPKLASRYHSSIKAAQSVSTESN